MIFITLGTQKFQFNRLLKAVDDLISANSISEKVFAQIGYSDYKPKNYSYKDFLSREEFQITMDRCDKVITHGGTGAIISAVKHGKKVIAIARLKEFGEHVDNHQLQIVKQFKELDFIDSVDDISDLEKVIKRLDKEEFRTYKSSNTKVVNSIENYIHEIDQKSSIRISHEKMINYMGGK